MLKIKAASSSSASVAIGSTITSGTEGAILFVGPSSALAQDAANFFYDNTLNQLYVGGNSGAAKIHTFAGSSTEIASIFQGAAVQTAALTEWRNSASGVLASMSAAGILSLGLAGTQTGTLKFNGTTSGVVTVLSAAAAGTWSFTLPTTGGSANYFLQTNGSGVSTWAEAYRPGGTDVAVADGGTGSSTASDARTALGLAIGSDVQAYDADLAALAALASNGLIARTGAGTVSARTITGTTNRVTVSNGDGVSGNPTLDVGSDVYTVGGTDVAVTDGGTGASTAANARTNLGLAIGSDVQAYDADLAALAALSSTGLIARTGSGTASVRTITGTSNKITVTDGDGVAGNPTLTVGSDIVQLTSTQTLTNKRITKRVLALSANSATPSINTDSYDVVHITAQTTAITSFTSGLSGTPVDGDLLRISVTGTGAVALTFGSSFEASGNVALSTTTVTTARLDMGFVWNTETSKWRQIAFA